MTEFGDWFYRIPFFTRYWLTFTLAISFLAKFNYLNSEYLILRHYPFFEEFHIWRPISALFFYPINPATGLQLLVNCYIVYDYSSRLECGAFYGRPAEYFTLLYFNWLVCAALALVFGLQYLMDPVVMSVLQVWSHLYKDVEINFFFGSQFKAMYLPLILMVFNIIVNRGGLSDGIGILVGYLGFFLMFKYPQEPGGIARLSPPRFLKKLVPDFRTM